MRQLVYYIATSLDGFIADPSGDFSRFPVKPETLAALFDRYPETCPTQLREMLGVHAEPRRFDTVLMGSRSYEPAVSAGLADGAYPHLRQIVATHRDGGVASAVETITGDLVSQVSALKEMDGQDIWLCGGGDLAAQLIDQIDEIQLKINPVLLGQGIPLFRRAVACSLRLVECTALPGGVMLATYSPEDT